MEAVYELSYSMVVNRDDLPSIDKIWVREILTAVKEKLTVHPDIYGKSLRGGLHGYRKLRVGDYRVIFKIEKKMVKILCIGHRKHVYEVMSRRA
jgi:mRNA interferase RelE/StbE